MPDREPSCPECGTALRGVNETQLEQHIDRKQPIICGNCGESSSAKEWRDGKTPRTLAIEAEEKKIQAQEEAEGKVKAEDKRVGTFSFPSKK